MPHINRFRLVNVNFNDAKGIYDDFTMTLNGKSTTYDLINTGGKSLLLLMLLQTVIPNTYLKKEKPIKNIFIGGNTKRSSHCLVEWILDDGYEYQYMLTGFCARKKQDIENDVDAENKLEIDYYNYCIFYNGSDKNDIKHIPLVSKENGEKIYMSYDKLRQFLSNLKREGKPVEIFDSKRDYMKYIEYYGLISAEWKLISEINVSENYIEKYFKENKTSRKLIENFLIKIIDNVNSQTDESEDDSDNQLADTLIELKDNLMKFRKKSDRKNEYIQTRDLYSSLKKQSMEIETQFNERQKIHKKAYEAYMFKKEKVDILGQKIKAEKEKIEQLECENLQNEKQIQKLNIDKTYYQLSLKENERNECKQQYTEAETKLKNAQEKLQLAKAQNEYVDYVESHAQAEKTRIQIENLSSAKGDLEKEYQIYGYNYKTQLSERIEELKGNLENQVSKKQEKQDAKVIAKKGENEARIAFAKSESKLEDYGKQIKEKQEVVEEIVQELTLKGEMGILLNLEEAITAKKHSLEEIKNQIIQNQDTIAEIAEKNVQRSIEINKIQSSISMLEKDKELSKNTELEYLKEKHSIETLTKTFECETIEKLEQKLVEELQEQEKQTSIKQIEKQMKSRKLELIQRYNMLVPNEEIIQVKEKLESKCIYVTTGIEKIMEMQEEKREDTLCKNPLFIYTVFVDETSFQKIKNKKLEIETEALVPIASVELLRSGYEYKEENILFPIQKNVFQSLSEDKLEEYKINLNITIEALDREIAVMKNKEGELRRYIDEVNCFIQKYTDEKVSIIYKEIEQICTKIKEAEVSLKSTNQAIEDSKEEKQNLENEQQKMLEQEKDLQEIIGLIENLTKCNAESSRIQNLKASEQREYGAIKEMLEEKQDALEYLEEEIANIIDSIRGIEAQINEYSNTYNKIPEFQKAQRLEETFEQVKNHFKALNQSHAEISSLQEIYNVYESNMKKCEKTIRENNYTLEYFENKNEYFEKVSDTKIQELISDRKNRQDSLQELSKILEKKEKECESARIKAQMLIEQFDGEYIKENCIMELNEIEKTLKDYEISIKHNKQEINNLFSKIKEVDEQVVNLEKEMFGLEGFIEDKKIKAYAINTLELLESEIYSYKKIRDLSNLVDNTIQKVQRKFENDVRHMKESVENFYIKQDVLEQIEGLIIPNTLEECSLISNGLDVIIEQLDENIRSIEAEIKHLESYQGNFITKCFEKAEIIVRDLEKLPGLSRIKIGGRDINIIKLDLFEYEKEEKIRRMRDYIDKIIEEMDKRPDEISKEQLNEKLSSKALVAQIINIDKASVKLYKIEDIQEHSTYKKWEDDLGSDGQVNAIYFMFAVCIISYISMLTRKEGSSKTKKVIIVDNPFGATSAVFLWNVMFSILKENNVQLIAPGHNINKEIISKFEVNYVLKHEYYDGNKKSVVVEKELRTEDDIQNMNFEVIAGNQQSMF